MTLPWKPICCCPACFLRTEVQKRVIVSSGIYYLSCNVGTTSFFSVLDSQSCKTPYKLHISIIKYVSFCTMLSTYKCTEYHLNVLIELVTSDFCVLVPWLIYQSWMDREIKELQARSTLISLTTCSTSEPRWPVISTSHHQRPFLVSLFVHFVQNIGECEKNTQQEFKIC